MSSDYKELETISKARYDEKLTCNRNKLPIHLFREQAKHTLFPTKKTVLETIPKAFLFENKDCRVIIDCTEFPIHKPNRPLQQQRKINHCKDCNTLNGVIGIMPSGALCFVCRLHCGRISDRGLFLRSKPMDLLEPNHVAMAGKGLLIEEE
ncbi:uncharacterized protein TNCV_4642191 [Trichonephila clavipes]|nr:uncharacterized protein TNCV_4642191 [Trichonephila clavipes]